MKAICITEPNHIQVTDVPEPADPGPGEVLLRIQRVGICGSDLTIFRGLLSLVTFPLIPGHEVGGAIEALGDGVPDRWKVGQPVMVCPYTNCGRCSACKSGRVNSCRSNQTLGVQRDGFMTEYAVVRHEKLFTSETLGLDALTLVEPLTVGFHAAARGAVTEADTVVVVGSGTIGLGAIAGASARHARVVAVDIDDDKLALARRCGADVTINSGNESLHERLQAMTDGEGPDVMIEAVGLPVTFRTCVEEVCFAGRVVFIGYAKAPGEYDTTLFVLKELDIRGSRNALPEDFEAVIAHLESGAFPIDEVITRTVSLDEAPAALAEWSENPASATKIHIILPSDS